MKLKPEQKQVAPIKPEYHINLPSFLIVQWHHRYEIRDRSSNLIGGGTGCWIDTSEVIKELVNELFKQYPDDLELSEKLLFNHF